MSSLQPKHCKSCKKTLKAQYSHTLKSGNMIYIDENGRQWKGSVCPDCQNAKRQAQRVGFKKVLDK